MPQRRGETGPQRPAPKPALKKPAAGPPSKVIKRTATPGELNHKLRDLLGTHVKQAIQAATANTTKAIDKKLTDKKFLAKLSKGVLEQAMAEITARVDQAVSKAREEVLKEVADKTLETMREAAPQMGEAAFPRIQELMQNWLVESGAAGAPGAAPAVDLSSIEDRLARLEAGAPPPAEGEDAPPFLEKIEERLANMETARAEFAEQVAEQVASAGDRSHSLEKDIRATRDAFGALSERLDSLAQRIDAVSKLGGAPAAAAPAAAPANIDYKAMAEKVALLAVGPLMQAIDGRLGEVNFEDLGHLSERLTALEQQGGGGGGGDANPQKIAMQVLGPVMEAVEGRLDELDVEGLQAQVADLESRLDGGAAPVDADEPGEDDALAAAEALAGRPESDEGPIAEDDFEAFRRKRLEEKATQRYGTPSAVVDALAGTEGEEEEAPQDDYASAGGYESSSDDYGDADGYESSDDYGEGDGYGDGDYASEDAETAVDDAETAVDDDETAVDADETAVDADETAVDADETAIDADETAVDADDGDAPGYVTESDAGRIDETL